MLPTKTKTIKKRLFNIFLFTYPLSHQIAYLLFYPCATAGYKARPPAKRFAPVGTEEDDDNRAEFGGAGDDEGNGELEPDVGVIDEFKDPGTRT